MPNSSFQAGVQNTGRFSGSLWSTSWKQLSNSLPFIKSRSELIIRPTQLWLEHFMHDIWLSEVKVTLCFYCRPGFQVRRFLCVRISPYCCFFAAQFHNTPFPEDRSRLQSNPGNLPSRINARKNTVALSRLVAKPCQQTKVALHNLSHASWSHSAFGNILFGLGSPQNLMPT